MKKQLPRKNKKITKGMPSAVLLSIAIHAALFLLAGMLVVFTVVKKEEKKFEPPKAVERPKMKLKKPKVKIRKSSKPKPTTRIVTKMSRASMPDIQLPEMSGMGDGLGEMVGGFDMMPDLGETTLFGASQSIGNDFVGTFYDLKRDRSGRDISVMDTRGYHNALNKFVRGDWESSKLARFYQAPTKLYTTCFMVPTVHSIIAPEAFGVDTDGYLWAVHYKGKLVCPASHTNGITFRFWGQGNNILLVRVGGRLVLNAAWPGWEAGYYANLLNIVSPDSRRYFMGDGLSEVGDWITLEPGESVDMEVLTGENHGGRYCSMLVVEEKGVEYEKGKQGNPVLPMFKTAEPSHGLVDIIYRDLVPGEASVTNGPVFCDYDTSGRTVAANEPEPVEPAPPVDFGEHEMRTWTLAGGKAMEAEFVTVIGGKAVLTDSRGRHRKVPLAELSEEDQKFIGLAQLPEFNIDFSKKSSQYIGKISPLATSYLPPKVLNYVFSARLKQTSAGEYNHELHVEFFAIGSEWFGDRYVLLDRQESRFTPTKENERSHEFSGKTVRLTTYEFYGDHKGDEYASYLIMVADSRGKIIAHQTPKKWLFENSENLRKLSVGNYMDKTCTRTYPTRAKTNWY